MNKREEYLHNREINRRARVRELTERARKHFDKMYEMMDDPNFIATVYNYLNDILNNNSSIIYDYRVNLIYIDYPYNILHIDLFYT